VDFNLTSEQEQLRDVARAYLSTFCTGEFVRTAEKSSCGLENETWRKMAALGWHGLAESKESLIELCVIARECGRCILPGAFLTNALCTFLISSSASPSVRSRFLPVLIDGSEIHTYAVSEGNGTWDITSVNLRAVESDQGYALTGRKFAVPNMGDADYVHVFGRLPDGQLADFILASSATGLRSTDLKVIGGDSQAALKFENVYVERENTVVIDEAVAREIECVANCLECSYLVGLAERDLEITTAYAKERIQFNKPIGSFQAVQHMCADSVIDLDGMDVLVLEAIWATQVSDSRRDEIVSMAKSWCGEASRRIVSRGQQIHGAFGFTGASEVQLYFRRQRRPAFFWGTPEAHRRTLVDLIQSARRLDISVVGA
jgi:alkylation response protein AidB-like acyl-CoA dehydrogenase